MKDWEKVKGGVKKTHNWGYSIVYGSFEDCFTNSELIEVLSAYKVMVDSGAIDENDPTYLKIKVKAKKNTDSL